MSQKKKKKKAKKFISSFVMTAEHNKSDILNFR